MRQTLEGLLSSEDRYIGRTSVLYTPMPQPFDPILTGFQEASSPMPLCGGVEDQRYEAPGQQYNMPTPYEPLPAFGLSGPGEARAVYPGLVERNRPEEYDNTHGFHTNTELHSVLNDRFTKPISNQHNDKNY